MTDSTIVDEERDPVWVIALGTILGLGFYILIMEAGSYAFDRVLLQSMGGVVNFTTNCFIEVVTTIGV